MSNDRVESRRSKLGKALYHQLLSEYTFRTNNWDWKSSYDRSLLIFDLDDRNYRSFTIQVTFLIEPQNGKYRFQTYGCYKEDTNRVCSYQIVQYQLGDSQFSYDVLAKMICNSVDYIIRKLTEEDSVF
jgi:hypothetical protein